MVHTVDGALLARELGKRATAAGAAPLAVLIEVNVGGEAQKAGVAAGETSRRSSARSSPSRRSRCGG